MTPGLYRLLTLAAGPFLGLILERRRRAGKEDASRLSERLGVAGRPRPPGPLIWLHGASVGEAQSVLGLVERFLAFDPKPTILVTTGTVTAAGFLAGRLPAGALHQYVPVDHPTAVRRFLDHWRPVLAVFVESELWPNLLLGAARRRIPLALVNARMSPRSFAGWRRRPALIRPVLDAFDLILAQSGEDASRFERLGASSVQAVGNLKQDAPPPPVHDGQFAALSSGLGERPRWLAASTHDGEEMAAAAAHMALKARWPDLVTLIALRHPARAGAVARALAARGLVIGRRSAGDPVGVDTDIYLVDSMGEMGLFYRLCPIVFMGGSLVPVGGHNAFEAAQFGCCLLVGPFHDNCRDTVDRLVSAGAMAIVADGAALTAGIGQRLDDHALVERAGMAARTAAAPTGLTDRVAAALAPLYRRGHHARA